jgi:mutual gliding-motility protein MglA
MSLVNYASREITCKIVYYGPGRSGKTTNLQYIHGQVPDERKGKMVSLATETDRTLFFDFLPLDLGSVSGFQTRFQLYTVPGQVYYNATRKLVLQGADGVVFVADSQANLQEENLESFRNLQENLLGAGRGPAHPPHLFAIQQARPPRRRPGRGDGPLAQFPRAAALRSARLRRRGSLRHTAGGQRDGTATAVRAGRPTA